MRKYLSIFGGPGSGPRKKGCGLSKEEDARAVAKGNSEALRGMKGQKLTKAERDSYLSGPEGRLHRDVARKMARKAKKR